jgi:hypothetical protein
MQQYKLIPCMEAIECGKNGKNGKHEHLMRKLERFTDRIAGVEAEGRTRSIATRRAKFTEGVIYRPQPLTRHEDPATAADLSTPTTLTEIGIDMEVESPTASLARREWTRKL